MSRDPDRSRRCGLSKLMDIMLTWEGAIADEKIAAILLKPYGDSVGILQLV